MTSEIHITRELVERLIRGGISSDERQALLEHLTNSGRCERCSIGYGPDDDGQYDALLRHYEHVLVRTLRGRAQAGDQNAEHELMDLRFQALERQLRMKNGRRKVLASFRGRLMNLGSRLFGGREE